MVKYIVSYLLVYSGLICAQIVNPVSMSVDTVSPARAGEVVSVYVDAATVSYTHLTLPTKRIV